TAHHILPCDLGAPGPKRIPGEIRQQEAPVRAAALALMGLPRGCVQLEGSTVVNRRQPARKLDLAPALQLLGGLETGIEQTCSAQPLCRRLVEMRAARLPFHRVGPDAEPGEIALDLVGIFLTRTFDVRIVKAQDEPAASLS